MKSATRLLPVLGVATAVLTVVAAFLVVRFAPAPLEIATGVTVTLLVVLGVLGYLGTTRGHAPVFMAIALVLPCVLVGTTTYALLDRASAELGAFLDIDESEGDGTYGSDPELDALQDECVAGDDDACDQLFFQSPSDSEYEETALEEGGGGE